MDWACEREILLWVMDISSVGESENVALTLTESLAEADTDVVSLAVTSSLKLGLMEGVPAEPE